MKALCFSGANGSWFDGQKRLGQKGQRGRVRDGVINQLNVGYSAEMKRIWVLVVKKCYVKCIEKYEQRYLFIDLFIFHL